MARRHLSLALLTASLSFAGTGSGILAQHDYDPLGDRTVSLKIDPHSSAGQSFVLPAAADSAVAIRMKVMKSGTPGALEYRLGLQPGAADLAHGSVPAGAVTAYFETFVRFDLHGAKLPAGRTLHITLSQAPGGAGHYEVWGTTSAGEEGPINFDYGAVTPAYAGGEAYDGAGNALPATDLAFQVVSARFAPRSEEPFAFMRDLTGPARYRKARLLNARSGAGEVRLDGSWQIETPAGAAEVVRTAVEGFRRFLAGEMNVPTTHGPKTIEFRIDRQGLSKPESFRLSVTTGNITITGYDDRALMRGLYYLQDEMDLRQAPVLTIGTITRGPRYSPRISCAAMYAGDELNPGGDPYTDGLLERMSRAGFNAIFVWAKLHELGRSPALPELGTGAGEKLTRLNALVDRASRYGIDVYLYVALDPLPAAFFDKHPDARGIARQMNSFYGSGYLLCTSAPVVQRFIREATASVFRAAPGIKGAIMIPYGEGLYNCRANARLNTCPRCSNRSRDGVLSELIGLISQGAHSVNPNASVVAWTYTWPESDPSRAQLIAQLPKDTIWLQTFEKEGLIRRDSVVDPAYDYTIALLGPSENFRLQVPLVTKAGLPLWIKTESMISQEYVQCPYIPVPQRFIERYRRIARYPQATGLFMNWSHNGFQPSRIADLVKWYTWDPLPEDDSVLRRMAERDFGSRAAPLFVEAWNKLSEAIASYPLSDNTSRNGPFQKGPAHPFFWDAAYRPHHHDKRQFFNSLEWTQPWDIQIAGKYFGRMERGWTEGVRLMRQATALTAPEDRSEARRELGLATVQLSCVRTALHLIEFFRLRSELATAPNRPEVLGKMRQVLEDEKRNAAMALEFVDEDSRLGYTNGGNGITNGGVRAGIFTAASIRKKLAGIDRLLDVEIPRATAAVNHDIGNHGPSARNRSVRP